MYSRGFFRRLAAGVVVLAVSGATVLVTAVVANAQQPPGTLTLLPATGTNQTRPTVDTSGPCPQGTTNSYNIVVDGPGTFDGTITGTATAGISFTGPFQAQFALSMENFAQTVGQPIPVGRFDIALRCVSTFGQEGARFTTAMFFTSPTAYTTTDPNAPSSPSPSPVVSPSPSPVVSPSPSPVVSPSPSPVVSPSPTPPPGGVVATSTTLHAFPSPAIRGLPVILVARVSPPAAEGTVQFMDGTASIGEPVPVFAGFAFQLTFQLDRGPHTLTAVFTPTDSTSFGPSTSRPERLTVVGLFDFLFRNLMRIR